MKTSKFKLKNAACVIACTVAAAALMSQAGWKDARSAAKYRFT